MSVFHMLETLADKLDNPDNEILVESEKHGVDAMSIVAGALANCSDILRSAADKMKDIEVIETESLEEAVQLIHALDNSGDPELQKLASVFDELLVTISSPKKAKENFKKAEETEISKLKEKYREEEIDGNYNKATIYDKVKEDTIKQVENKVKSYRPMEYSLNTRYSPDMPGVSLIRIADGVYQCPITKKIYNFSSGYTTMEGEKVPGTSVENQTNQMGFNTPEQSIFNTRDEALNSK